MTALWQRLRDAWITGKTKRLIDERECRHDGSEPWCEACAGFFNGV